MIKSMTGFGRGEISDSERKITIEMKSVNHRYLDISLKMPKKFSIFEAAMRGVIREYAERGKLDIYVTCEAYTQSEGHSYLASDNYRTLDLSNNVTAVGDALAEALADLGVELIHDRSYNDYPSYNASYGVAREKIQAYLEQYPSIVLVLDLHRDALENPVRETVARDGRLLAPLMLAVGSDQGGLNHPHWEDNLSCGLKLQALGLRDQPSLFKKLSFRKERFNGDLSPGALIVEVGSTENTLEEAQASMPYLARYIAELLRCP